MHILCTSLCNQVASNLGSPPVSGCTHSPETMGCIPLYQTIIRQFLFKYIPNVSWYEEWKGWSDLSWSWMYMQGKAKLSWSKLLGRVLYFYHLMPVHNRVYMMKVRCIMGRGMHSRKMIRWPNLSVKTEPFSLRLLETNASFFWVP